MASRGCQLNCGRPSTLRWTWCLCLLVCRVLTAMTGHPDYVIQTTRRNWWSAAQGCEEFGGRLYIPPSLDNHEDLAAILDRGQTYWIGAMEYSTWTWTSDNSPLYEHTGYMQFPPSGKPTEIEGNSAFLCHLHCGKTYTRIGLSRNSCYCLIEVGYHADIGKTVTETRCPGNHGEWCGDDRGVSVYEIVDMDITQALDGQCVYARKNRKRLNLYFSSFYNDDNCSTRRSLAFTQTGNNPGICHGTTCVEHGYRSWDEAEARHTLLKVSAANLDDLTDAMTYTTNSPNVFTYWIGLRRLYRRVWINGSDVSLDNDVHTDRFCLSLRKSTNNYTTLSWNPCTYQLMSVCQVARPLSSSTSSDYSTTTFSPPRTPSTETGTSPDADSTSSTDTTFTTSSYASVRLNIGTRIGISVVGVAILGATVAAFMIMKRRKLLFFGAKPTTSTPGNIGYENGAYTTSADEHIYDSVMEYPGMQGQLPLPVATVRPMLNVYMNDTQSKEEGYDVLSKCSSFLPPSVKPYDRAVVGRDGTVSQGGYDRVRISYGRTEFSCNFGRNGNGCPDQNESLSLQDDPMQEDSHPGKSNKADDRNQTMPGAPTTYWQHQNRRLAGPVYENVSRCEQSFSHHDYVNMENVCRNVITSQNGCYSNNGQSLETEIAMENDGRQRLREATDA